ncbi:hypothetical protein B566_EDAN009055 [Ephemera danica]|nr:hypothetical protein B566_EDAN009055 [Ephemera danica]
MQRACLLLALVASALVGRHSPRRCNVPAYFSPLSPRHSCSLRGTGAHDCGCVILNDGWILTSATCSDVALGLTHTVHVGSNHINEGGVVYNVGRVTKHEQYDAMNISSPDIAVKETIVWSPSVQPAVLPMQNGTVPADSIGTIIGWGWTAEEGPVSPQLLEAEQRVLSDAECQSSFTFTGANHLCSVGTTASSGFCKKDEGGPLIVNGVVEGLMSWTNTQCSSDTMPGVYMRIASYRDWIQAQTGA